MVGHRGTVGRILAPPSVGRGHGGSDRSVVDPGRSEGRWDGACRISASSRGRVVAAWRRAHRSEPCRPEPCRPESSRPERCRPDRPRPGPLLPGRVCPGCPLRRVVRRGGDLDGHLLPTELSGPDPPPGQHALLPDRRGRSERRVPGVQALPARRLTRVARVGSPNRCRRPGDAVDRGWRGGPRRGRGTGGSARLQRPAGGAAGARRGRHRSAGPRTGPARPHRSDPDRDHGPGLRRDLLRGWLLERAAVQRDCPRGLRPDSRRAADPRPTGRDGRGRPGGAPPARAGAVRRVGAVRTAGTTGGPGPGGGGGRPPRRGRGHLPSCPDARARCRGRRAHPAPRSRGRRGPSRGPEGPDLGGGPLSLVARPRRGPRGRGRGAGGGSRPGPERCCPCRAEGHAQRRRCRDRGAGPPGTAGVDRRGPDTRGAAGGRHRRRVAGSTDRRHGHHPSLPHGRGVGRAPAG